MADKRYTYRVVTRAPRPRSRRLREQGIGTSANSTVIMSGSGGGGGAVGDGHTHTNLSALNEITTDNQGYEYLTQMREVDDPDGGGTKVEKVTEKVKAGFADVAHDLSEDSPVRQQFLSRLVDDVAKGNLTFEKMLTV